MSKNQVIIIGAGIAGLAAAVELIENGVHNIVLIEASNRLGGRIFSIPSGDNSHVIELGAQWIHGEKKNPIFELCSKIGIVDKDTKTEFGNVMYYATQDGKKMDDDDVEQLFDKFETIFDEIEDEAEELGESEDRSLGSMIETKFNTFLNKLSAKTKLSNEKYAMIKSVLNARLKEEMADNACSSLNDLSAIGWNEYIDCEGDNMVNLKFGYGELIQYLSSKIPPERVIVNEIVTKIKWPHIGTKEELADHVVTVTTFNPTTKTESIYYGTQCLCTISLGCLKETHKELFEPKLPVAKINAIEKLGFGTVNKVFLVFPEPIFQYSVQGLQILWRDDLQIELESVKKWKLKNKNFVKSFTTFEVLPTKRNILYTFIVGPDAKYIEELDNACLVEVLHELLTKCFNKIEIPEPIALMKSGWYSNVFARGSYSYVKVNSTLNDVRALAQPLNDKVHFAGEATDYKFMSTVHGAYKSGLKSAKQIAKELLVPSQQH